MNSTKESEELKVEVATDTAEDVSKRPDVVRTNSHLEENHIELGWRSWMVVFVACFA
jgi:hypothetical protein